MRPEYCGHKTNELAGIIIKVENVFEADEV